MSKRPSILITGGARRIGWHCAQRLLDDGFEVLISCRSLRPDWPEALPAHCRVLLADFCQPDGAQQLIAQLDQLQPRLRAIIHNASLWLEDDADGSHFEMMYRVHMLAPWMINRAATRWFDGNGAADIIHITDDVVRRGSRRHPAYCATKAGLESLTLSFAAELAPHIKVNSIAPALIMFNEQDSAEYRSKTLAKSALGIEPGPEVVYQAIRSLMDNPYVTGTRLQLNGGRHLV